MEYFGQFLGRILGQVSADWRPAIADVWRRAETGAQLETSEDSLLGKLLCQAERERLGLGGCFAASWPLFISWKLAHLEQ